MNEILDFLLSPNTKAYSQSITIFFATLLILLIFKKFFEGIFKKRAENTENKIDDAMSEVFKQIKSPLIIIFGLYAASLTFDFSNSLEKIFSLIFQGSLILQILLLSQAFIKLSFEVYLQTNKNRSKELKTLFDYITKFLVFILWIIGILLFLSNAGYNISSLIASLGIGGLAIALAVQNILKDILSTVMILINKPFQVGDYVKLSPTEQGTITKIGMRNTIIKTIDSEELIVTNDDMLNSRIINFRNKNKRRVDFNLLLDLKTTSKKLETTKKEIEKIINSNELVDTKKTRIVVSEFSERAIVVNIVYKMVNNDYSDYIITRDNINLKIKSFIEKEKIELAKIGTIS